MPPFPPKLDLELAKSMNEAQLERHMQQRVRELAIRLRLDAEARAVSNEDTQEIIVDAQPPRLRLRPLRDTFAQFVRAFVWMDSDPDA